MDTDAVQKTEKPISDDQELAKALAGIGNSMDFEETPSSIPQTVVMPTTNVNDGPNDKTLADEPKTDEPATEPREETVVVKPPIVAGDLDSIKKNALLELRPLMDKLNLKADEKFDIYLLLLRSTDDKTLIAPAHEAARNISDETKRAQALLDVIKEIDFLTNPQT